MKAVVQRVNQASVEVDGKVVGQIARGIAVLAAIEKTDTHEQVKWMAGKLAQLRIFPNGEKNYDLDVMQIRGQILLVSNFTVAAACAKGRRPSLDGAASPNDSRVLFDALVAAVRALGIPVQTGEFGADMKVTIENDGPVTFIVDSNE